MYKSTSCLIALLVVTTSLGINSCGGSTRSGGGNSNPTAVPRVAQDPNALNKPGTREQSFMWDEWSPDVTLTAWARIAPDNTFVTRVVVNWMDNPDGLESPLRTEGRGDEATPEDERCRFGGDTSRYRTSPCRWAVRLPVREGMRVGGRMDYMFNVFFKRSPGDDAEQSATMGYRDVKLGPPQGRVSFDGENLSLDVNAESDFITVTLSTPPPAGVLARFYSDPEGVLQVLDEEGRPADGLWFDANQFVKRVKVKPVQASGGAANPGNNNVVQSGLAVLWVKASGWKHDFLTVNVR